MPKLAVGPDLAGMYRAGGRGEAWALAQAMGSDVYSDTNSAACRALVDEAMLRVRQNLDAIIQHLYTVGYAFLRPEMVQAPLSRSNVIALGRLARQHGPVAMSLRSFYEIIGSVDLMGTHPEISDAVTARLPDPFVVDAPSRAWPLEQRDAQGRRMFGLDISPDDLHKANYSGGGPYSVVLPASGIDGILVDAPYASFLTYVRAAMTGCGFAGYAEESNPPDFILELRDKLVEI